MDTAVEKPSRRKGDHGFLRHFTGIQGAIAAAAALVMLGGAITGLVFRGQVQQVEAKNVQQDQMIKAVDEENELQFQNDVRIAEALKHIDNEVQNTRKDMRVIWGSRLPPTEEDHDLEIPIARPSPRPTVTP